MIKNNFLESIGNTQLIKLKMASEITGCNIYGKAEYQNPGGSVKDRAALALIRDAEEKKLITKGGTIVEGTAGNTGIGLCLLGNSIGYKTIIVMNDNQTQEKKDLLRNIGADLRLVPPKPAFFAISTASIVSVKVPIWFNFIKIEFILLLSIAFCSLFLLVTVKSSPTIWN